MFPIIAKSYLTDISYSVVLLLQSSTIMFTREQLSLLTKDEVIALVAPYTPGRASRNFNDLTNYALSLPKDIQYRLLHAIHNREYLNVLINRKRKRDTDAYHSKRNKSRRKTIADVKREQRRAEWIREKGSQGYPCIVDFETKKQCMREFLEATGDDAVKRDVCVVCARELWHSEGQEMPIDELPSNLLLPRSDIQPYKQDIIDGKLLLSSHVRRRSQERKGEESKCERFGWVCNMCRASMERGKRPPLSLSNELWIGDPPEELRDLTFTEEILIARAHPRCYVFKMFPRMNRYGVARESLQRGMRGNVTSYHANVDSIADMVEGNIMPRPMSVLPHLIAVCFIGIGKLPKDWIKKTFAVRRDKLRRALLWLKENNRFYEDVQISEQRLQTIPEDGVPKEIEKTIREINNLDDVEKERAGYVPEDDFESTERQVPEGISRPYLCLSVTQTVYRSD